MELEEWKNKMKLCVSSQKFVGFYDLKIKRYSDTKIVIIKKNEKKACPTCKREFKSEEEEIEVEFNNKQDNLTIFEAGILYMVYVRKERPYDYANFDKCVAGQRFIKNIKDIQVIV